jgi:hypothetical protein
METAYDWITVALFAALAVLFLQRSTRATPADRIWHYAPPTIGCAAANWTGNHGHHFLAIALIVGVVAYVLAVLKPTLPTR